MLLTDLLHGNTQLLTFWMANLPEHPQWKTSPPPELTGAVRKILLRQIGVRNAENTLYQNVLQQVSRNYADMTLADMTGDTLTESLFSTEQTVPGMFTVRHGKDRSGKLSSRW